MEQVETVYEKYRNYIGNWQRHDGKYGVEIETESLSPYKWPSMAFWRVDHDGSLRNFGAEYISVAPFSDSQLSEALEEFDALPIDFIENSISTSVHIHYNTLNMTGIQVLNAITAYTIFEPMLCKFSGPYRESNLFCLQLKDAEGGMYAIQELADFLSLKQTRKFTSVDSAKYAALNVGSFWRYGSIEFRSLRGTSDVDLIKKWSKIINCIFEYSKQFENPDYVVQAYQKDPKKFFNEMFGEYVNDLMYDGWKEDSDMNLWYAWRISQMCDWGDFGKKQTMVISRDYFNQRVQYWTKNTFNTPTEILKGMALIDCQNKYGFTGSEEGVDYIFDDQIGAVISGQGEEYEILSGDWLDELNQEAGLV